jgi:hypothetical protein
MSTVYNPEADTMALIERMEIEARDLRRRVESARNDEDKRILSRQLQELQEEIARLQAKLPC